MLYKNAIKTQKKRNLSKLNSSYFWYWYKHKINILYSETKINESKQVKSQENKWKQRTDKFLCIWNQLLMSLNSSYTIKRQIIITMITNYKVKYFRN